MSRDRTTSLAVVGDRDPELGAGRRRDHVLVGRFGWKCLPCGCEMLPGIALVSTLVGEEDDIGGCVTLSAGGPGRIVDVLKCFSCGHSIIPPVWPCVWCCGRGRIWNSYAERDCDLCGGTGARDYPPNDELSGGDRGRGIDTSES